MNNMIDYGFLFQQMFGSGGKSGKGGGLSGVGFQLSNLNSPSVQSQLKAAGIDTNSAQYKAVMGDIQKNARGNAFVNIQGIKNRMSNYDSNGDYICPAGPFKGLTGLVVTDENIGRKNRIINIPESSKDEMFENAKREFLQENGVANGDTTRRSEVYANMYWKVKKDDRLAAGHTLGQYERAYNQAFADAAKKADPKWKPGMKIPAGALDGITRESVDKNLARSGNDLRLSVDYRA